MTFIYKNNKKHSGIKNNKIIKVNKIFKIKCKMNLLLYILLQGSSESRDLNKKCFWQKIDVSKSSELKIFILINPKMNKLKILLNKEKSRIKK